MSAAVDYIEEAERGSRRGGRWALGVPEMVDMDNAIIGGERSAEQIAEDMGVSSRMVQRRRKLLRERGLRFDVPEAAEDVAEYGRRACAIGRATQARRRDRG